MTTTGTYSFDPQLAEILDEAFERAGVDPAAPGTHMIQSARRSLRFMLNSEWASFGQKQWLIAEGTETMTVGKVDFYLPPGAVDILDAVLRRNDKDTEMYGISRDEYLTLVDKSSRGRPDRWFLDKSTGRKHAFIWQAGSNTTDVMVYNYFRQMQDATGTNTSLKATLEMPVYAAQACVTGLAFRLAEKFNRDRMADLRTEYGGPMFPTEIGGHLKQMLSADRETGDIDLYAAYEPRRSRR